MRSISAKDKSIWLSDTAHKTYELKIGDEVLSNADIVEDSIMIEGVLEDSEQLEFSGCHAKSLKVDLIYRNESAFGLPVELKAKAELGDDETEWLVLFTGKVTALTQKSADDILSSLMAYDALQEVNNFDLAEWYKGLTFPITLGAFRTSLRENLASLGVEMEDSELPLDSMTIDQTIAPETLAGRDVLIAIATLNARYCVCDAENVIRFVALDRLNVKGLYPAEDLFPSDDLFPEDPEDNAADWIESPEFSGLNYRNYDVLPIDKVVLREDEDDIGAIYGTGLNAYIVEGNFLLYGKSAADLAATAEAVYELVEGYSFTPAVITGKARPWLEMGDLVRVDSAQNVIFTYVLQAQFSGLQNTNGSYGCSVKKDRVKQLSSINTQVLQLRGKSNKLVRDVEHMSSAIYDEEGNSRIEQNASAIELKVSKGDVSSQLSLEEGKIEIKSNRISIDSTHFKLTDDGIMTLTSDTTGFVLNPVGERISSLDVVMKVGKITEQDQNVFMLTKTGTIYARSLHVGLNEISLTGISAQEISSATTISAVGAITSGTSISTTGTVSGNSVTATGTVKGMTIEATSFLKVGVTSYSGKSLTWTPIYAANGYTVIAYGLSPYSATRPTAVLGG